MSTTRRQRGGSLETLIISQGPSRDNDELDQLVEKLKEEFGPHPTLRRLLANLQYLPQASEEQLISWIQEWFKRQVSGGEAPLNQLARGNNLQGLLHHPQAGEDLLDCIARLMGELSPPTNIEPTLQQLVQYPYFWTSKRIQLITQHHPVQVLQTLFAHLDERHPAQGRETALELLLQQSPDAAFRVMQDRRHQAWITDKHWAKLLSRADEYLRPQIIRHRGQQPPPSSRR